MTHVCRVFLFSNQSFAYVGTEITWVGEGVDEYGHVKDDPENIVVRVDPRYFRPTEVELLLVSLMVADLLLYPYGTGCNRLSWSCTGLSVAAEMKTCCAVASIDVVGSLAGAYPSRRSCGGFCLNAFMSVCRVVALAFSEP